MMSPINVAGEIAAQKHRLTAMGCRPELIRFSQVTHDELADAAIGRRFGNMIEYDGLEVQIDNALPFGVVRVLGAMK